MSENTHTILIADDDPQSINLLRTLLREHGYQVRVATNGVEALSSAQRKPPDLLLLDIRMPDLSGYEVCERLKADERTKDIPVIFISVVKELLDKVKAFAIGGVDYVTKPFIAEEVLARVKTHLELSRARKAIQQHAELLEQRVAERTAELQEANRQLRENIAERKQAEDQLRITKEYAENLIETANAIVIGMDRDGNVTAFNHTAERITGYTQSEMLNRNWFEVIVPKDRYPDVWDEFERLLAGGLPKNFENPILTKDGKERYIVWQNNDVREHGNIVGTISFGIDITGRKRADEALRKSEALLNITQHLTKVGGWEWDVQNQAMFWTEETYRIHGFNPNEIEPGSTEHVERSLKCYDPDDRSVIWEAFERCAQQGESYDLEFPFTTVQGHRKWIRTTAKAEKEQGKVVKVIGNIMDITERKHAEEKLRESEERFRNMMEQAPFAIAIFTPDGRICEVNPAWRQLWGIPEDILPQLLENFNILNDEQCRELGILPLIEKAFAGEAVTLPPIEYDVVSAMNDLEVANATGRKVWIQPHLYPLKGAHGEILNIVDMYDDITERKQAEEKLRESEERFRSMMEQAPFAIEILTPDGRISQVNPAWRQLWEMPEELVPQALEKYNMLRDEQCRELGIMPLIEKAFAGEPVMLPPIEYDIVSTMNDLEMTNAHGRKPWIQSHLYPLKSANGEILNIVNMYDDITERKQAEEALRKDEEILEQIFATTNSMIAYMDRDFNFIRVNRAYADTGGREPEDFIGKNHFVLYPHEENETIFRHVVETGKPYIAAAKPFEHPDQPERGTTYWDWTLLPVKGEQGDVTALLLSLSDVTEQKQAELVLQKHREHLEELVKERTAELEQSRQAALSLMQDAKTQRHRAEEARKAAEEAKQRAEAAQRASEAAQKASEAANRAKSEFLANMSHELRTPMNAVLGFAQLMQRDAALTDTQREHLDTILRSGEHLLKLINDVLDMSRIEAGRISVNITTFNLWHLLFNVEEMLRIRTEKKSLQFTVVRSPDVPQHIRTDESKLRQVLVNLLGNAVKFTEEGEVSLRVSELHELHELKDSPTHQLTNSPTHQLLFEISDTGIGIAAEELDTIFETFGRTQQSERTVEGTGLGLAISQQFVRLLGGDIHVESEVGKGSIFTFEIQVEVVEAAEISTENDGRRVIGLEPDQHTAKGSPYRILIAEDTEESRHLLSELLKTVGFEVQEATNGQEALEKFTLWQPHLIWMDMRMPVMDGYEATKRIRELEQQEANGQSQEVKGDGRTESTLHLAPCSLHPVPIIALTASAFEEECARILEAGCNDVVRKPILEREIFETIHKHIGVQYVYAEDAQGAGSRGQGARKEALTPEALATLPSELLNSLEQAVLKGEVDTIERIIDTIRPDHAAVAEAMTALVRDFKYQDLWTMIGQVRTGMG